MIVLRWSWNWGSITLSCDLINTSFFSPETKYNLNLSRSLKYFGATVKSIWAPLFTEIASLYIMQYWLRLEQCYHSFPSGSWRIFMRSFYVILFHFLLNSCFFWRKFNQHLSYSAQWMIYLPTVCDVEVLVISLVMTPTGLGLHN